VELPVSPSQLIDLLRAWFFAKDRSVVLAASTFVEGANIATPGTPVINRGRLYWKDKCWYQLDEDGVETSLCNGIWADWTPTVDQNGAVAATITFARYIVDGAGVVTLTAKLVITGAGSIGNFIRVQGIPPAIAPKNRGQHVIGGSGVIFDNSGTKRYSNSVELNGPDDLRFLGWDQADRIGVTPSFALAADDEIGFTVTYER
jgi:hypothetical protein